MRKKILIGVGVFILLLAGAAFYLNHRNRTLSPGGSAEITAKGLTASVTYSRPSVRDRVVFGTEAEGALQPYGVYWRLGANESTELTINKDVLFNGVELAAGTYKVYAFPGESEFEIGVNTTLDTWGYSEPDYEKDVIRTRVPVTIRDEVTEQHTLDFNETDEGIELVCEFEKRRFAIPINPR